jgi:hypothetical protein
MYAPEVRWEDCLFIVSMKMLRLIAEMDLARESWAKAEQDLLDKLPGGIVRVKIELETNRLSWYFQLFISIDLPDIRVSLPRLATWLDNSPVGIESH